MTDCFEKNTALFEYKNPRAVALFSCIEERVWSFCKTEKDEPNLSYQNKIFLHDQKGALDEAYRWAKTLDLDQTEVFVVFGVGLGYEYVVLKDWLQESSERQLIFLEDDLALLHRFLETDQAYDLLQNRQAHLYYLENSQEGVEVLQGISWACISKSMKLSAQTLYQKKRAATFQEIQDRLSYEMSDIHAVVDEYLNHGISYFRNFWRNLFLLDGSFSAGALFKAFHNIPAIVVAAGPSLQKELPLLHSLQDRALIIAGGSSVNILNEAGIFPHFASAIDPNPLQYMRLRQNLAFTTPFFYRSRLLHEAACAITGPRLYLRGGDGYNISDYFEKKAKIRGKILGGGHSIANFNIEIAHALGCSPIILVGYDLAFGKDRSRYAPGVEESHPASLSRGVADDVVCYKDCNNNPILTSWKWVLEGQWIEEFIAKHGKKRFINATGGGLGIRGIRQMSLQSAVDTYLTKSYDLRSLVHRAVEEADVCTISDSVLVAHTAKLFDSLTNCTTKIDQIIAAMQTLQLGMRDVHPLENPEIIMHRHALEKECGFEYVLEVFDRMRTKLEYYQAHFLSHPSQSAKDEISIEIANLTGHYTFLKEVCIVNQLIIERALEEQQELGKDITSFQPKKRPDWQLEQSRFL